MAEQRGSGFLRRWSRRKQQEGNGEAAVTPVEHKTEVEETPGAAPDRELATAAAGAQEPVPLTDADMPSIDSLDADSDFAQFLSEGVSDALRRRALRKLFALPEFGVLDGLNDYDDDFTQFAPLGDTVTYQMKQWLKKEAEAALEDESSTPETAAKSTPSPAASQAQESISEELSVADDEEDADALGEADG